jgi:lipopolysaccharide transport system permease protein
VGWTLINPLLVVGAYWIVFKFLFGTPIPNYALFLFVGLMVWSLFFGGLTVGSQSLIANAALVTKVRFPRAIIPAAAISANAVIALVMLAIALPLCIWQSTGSLVPLIALPAFLVLAFAMTVGLGLILSAINVYFRDVEHVIQAVGVPWFFLTPIFYTYATLPEAAQQHQTIIAILHWGNPISPFVIAVQDTLFFGQWPTIGDSLYCVIAAIVALGLGWLTFRRLEPEMAVEL